MDGKCKEFAALYAGSKIAKDEGEPYNDAVSHLFRLSYINTMLTRF
jgi:hypothetical protein